MKRTLLALAVAVLVPGAAVAQTKTHDIPLAPAGQVAGTDLAGALKARQSTREFMSRPVSLDDLAKVLWAANGITRKDGRRTAPSAYGKYFVTIYIALDGGTYRYDPQKNVLRFLSDADIRTRVAAQGYVGNAPCVMILTSKLDEFPYYADTEHKKAISFATAGAIGENVYLMAAALRLGTCLVAGIDAPSIKEKLQLKDTELPLFVMPLGYLK